MTKTLFAALAVLAFLWTTPAKADDAATIAGKWHFVLDTEGGDRTSDSIFELSGDKVTGKWSVTDAKKDGDPVAGTFSGKQLTLEFPIVSDEAGPGTLKLKGKLADDGTLSGDWYFGDYTGTFKATRTTK